MNLKDNIKTLTDKELVDKIVQTNDTNLFAVLYDRYVNVVYNKCYGFTNSKEESQDLTHDLFLQLFVKLRTFKGTSSFSTWLYSMTYNFCVNYVTRDKYKKNKKEIKNDQQLGEPEYQDVSEEYIFQLKTKKLNMALDRLDPHDKIILLMKYQDDFSIKDIGNALEIGESAVKMRLKRARSRVVSIYEKLK